MIHFLKMKTRRCFLGVAAFSLVELTLAIGVAAFALVTMLGMLAVGVKLQQTSTHQTIATKIASQIMADMRAAVRTPGNSQSHNWGVNLPPQSGSPWNPLNQLPQTVYFTNEGDLQQGQAGSVFTAKISYRSATATTALTDIVVYWPSAQTDLTKVAGSTETLINLNRPAPP
jgi:uncharacterized protein (TIGR02598 family)